PDTKGGVNSNYLWLTGDFNGDGLTDLVRRHDGGTNNIMLLSGGDGTWTIKHDPDSKGGVNRNYLWLTGDFNGDGLTDLVRRHNGGVSNMTFLSNGNGGWKQLYDADGYGGVDSSYRWFAGDVDGDGLTDLIRRDNNGLDNPVMFSNYNGSQRVSSFIGNGIGGVISVNFEPLTDEAIYTKTTTATYPEMDLQPSMQVVSQVTTDNGLGGTNKTTYHYEGLKANLHGRGSLGFQKMTVTDETSNITTTTTRSQSFPTTGMPTETEQKYNG
ncbi:MAG: hypothetical protein GY822_19690, partial [Deltaproteobacteria bacterium]|nr:hypothetical protein [Deltaproteobacteria bacterium]